MSNSLLKNAIGWGIGLWAIGYVLGFLFLFLLPPALIGWAIAPIGMAITLWVLIKKVKSMAFHDYVILAFAWTAIAVAFDYLFLVRLLHPTDGYYKLDVYLYYALTFVLPLAVGYSKTRAKASKPV
jgi:hypothetical protein